MTETDSTDSTVINPHVLTRTHGQATAAFRQTQSQRQAMRQRLIRYWDLMQEQSQQKIGKQVDVSRREEREKGFFKK